MACAPKHLGSAAGVMTYLQTPLRLRRSEGMRDPAIIQSEVFAAVRALVTDQIAPVTETTSLLGDSRALDSMKLVELCVALEDRAAEIGFEFDWTSDTAMSRSRSMFRTAGSLASEFIRQMESQ